MHCNNRGIFFNVQKPLGVRTRLKVLAIKIVGIQNELLNLEQNQQTSGWSWVVGGGWRYCTTEMEANYAVITHTRTQSQSHMHAGIHTSPTCMATYKHMHDSHTYTCISVYMQAHA